MENRRNFLKKLFGISVLAATTPLSTLAKTNDEFTFDELFEVCDGNENLFYLKTDSWLEKEIKNVLDNNLVDEKYFTYYLPLGYYLPVKEKYSKKDFENLLFTLTVKKNQDYYFCDKTCNHGKKYGTIQMAKNKKGYYEISMYNCRKPDFQFPKVEKCYAKTIPNWDAEAEFTRIVSEDCSRKTNKILKKAFKDLKVVKIKK